jgi:DNA polymerase
MNNLIKQEFLELTKGLKDYLNFERSALNQEFLVVENNPNKIVQKDKSKKGLTLEDIRAELGECKRCGLYKSRNKIVFGEGDPHAKLMFIGEGPGQDEDIQGRPFVGRAGQLLTKIIEAIGLKRSDVYIANVVKSRPPDNRAPLEDEIAACLPFLVKQIEVIKPKIIVALGSIAAKALLKTDSNISEIRGRFHNYKGIKVMPTFHPAYLLRNPEAKRLVWKDMQMVQKACSEL